MKACQFTGKINIVRILLGINRWRDVIGHDGLHRTSGETRRHGSKSWARATLEIFDKAKGTNARELPTHDKIHILH
jgi:hypothetical protein